MPPAAFGPAGPKTDLEAARGRALIDAAAAGIEQAVFSTVASGSTASRGSAGKALIEQYLHDHIALPTVLRPVRFMTNYLAAGIPVRYEQLTDAEAAAISPEAAATRNR